MTVVCVTLNPAEDRVVQIDTWPPAGTVRPRHVYASAGGKGINVARALHLLGRRVITTGLCGGRRGRWLIDELRREGLGPSFASITRETRVTYTLAGPHGETLVVAEPGPHVDERDFSGFMAHLRGSLLGAASFVVVSGSLPGGLGAVQMKELVQKVQAAGKRVIVDTSGEALLVPADIVKVNMDEAEEVGLGSDPASAARNLLQVGARMGIVTAGAQGAVLAVGGKVFRQPAPEIDVVSAVGAGDVFTAGLIDALLSSAEPQEALSAAGLAGAAACLEPRAGRFDPTVLEALNRP